MYGHRDQSHSGDRRDRHRSSHSSRERSKRQHREGRKERDHGHRGNSRRVSSGGGGRGGGGSGENEAGSRRDTSGTSDQTGRRSSRDGNHRSSNRTQDKVVAEAFTRSSQSTRSTASRTSSVDEIVGTKDSVSDLLVGVASTSNKATKITTEEPSSTSKGFGGFILHEAISPPSEDFEGGSIKAGGFEICMPVTRSNSDDSVTSSDHTRRRAEDLWGTVVQLRTTPSEDTPPKVSLWQKDWKPGPLTCTIPRATEALTPSSPTLEEQPDNRDASVVDHPRDRHGRNLLLHCIDMQRYVQETRDLLATISDGQDRETSSSEMVPEKPQRFYSPRGGGRRILSCDQITKLPTVSLSQHGLVQLLKKSTAAICSFSGYEWSSPEALNVVSDVMGKFLANFSRLLRMNADRCSGSDSCCGFQDALERSLREMGMSGKEGLCRYWKEEVEGQARLLEAEADEARNEGLRMTIAEEHPRSSKHPTLSSPFSKSRIFSLDNQENKGAVEEEEEDEDEEEITLEAAMKESQSQAQVTGSYNGPPPAPYSALASPDLRPPNYLEGFTPLEIDGPQRKKLRTSALDQDWSMM